MSGSNVTTEAEALLPRLLPVDVYTSETTLAGSHEPLHARELALTERFSPKRLQEFRAGRHAARLALRGLGSKVEFVLPARDRAPLWPDGVVGSITHTSEPWPGFSAAAVASSERYSGIGIDAEPDAPLDENLFAAILRPTELEWLENWPAPERGAWARVVFSVKECVYKCHYPITRTFLDFADLEVSLDTARGAFSARYTRDVVAEFPAGSLANGVYLRDRGLIVAAMTWPARQS